MIQLNLTSDGLAAKTRNNNLIFTKFVTGSGTDDNGESIQSQKQLVDISYSQVYNAGSTYTVNGSSYVEQINHVKICGTLLFSEALEDYTLTEIALMAKEGSEGTEFVFAYGANSQNSINVLSGDNTTYSLILDIIFDTTPNVPVITNGTGVTYSDLIAHINTNVINGVHGLNYTNDDLKINGVSLDICKNDIFQKTTGITTYDTLPTPSLADEGRIVYNKQNSFSYKCVKSVEISVGDYIYEDNGSWSVGDGTENGALEVITDNSTPSSGEITLSNAQSHFMEWVITNNITKRLFSAEQQIENKSNKGHSHLTSDITDITATASELNKLHGVTTTSTEINYLSGVNSNIQTQINNIRLSAFYPLWTANATYSVGDVVKTLTSSFWVYLECVVAGTSDTTEPTFTNVGELVTDGTVKWLVLDLRDSAPVGTIKQDIIKRDGWLKLNGATVNVADYPRLISFLTANSLLNAYTATPDTTKFYYGDSNNETLLLPDFEGLFIENSASNTLEKVKAGLPNITGEYKPKLAMSGYSANRNKISVDTANGAFKDNLYSGTYAISGGLTYDTGYTDNDPKGVTFNASYSNSIYGNSTTVQPPAVKLIPIIKY